MARDWHSPRELLDFIFRSSKRAAVFVVGVALFVLGVALIPLPGPFSIPLMIAGLAVLATEFVWAERMLDKVKEQAGKAKDRAGSFLRRRRGASQDPRP